MESSNSSKVCSKEGLIEINKRRKSLINIPSDPENMSKHLKA
jgi:hypothetical protein